MSHNYRIEYFHGLSHINKKDILEKLQQYGKDGWELVTIQENNFWVFKQAISEKRLYVP